MLKSLEDRRLNLITGLDFLAREKRWRLQTAKGVDEVLSDEHKRIDYDEVARPIKACEYEIKTRLKLYDIVERLQIANDGEQLVPYLYCLAQEYAKKRRTQTMTKGIQAGILAGEAAAAAAILSRFVEVPAKNAEQKV